MITREAFVEEVMTWVGTPFHHRGRLKHVGVDCVGLVIGSLKEFGITVRDMSIYPRFPIHGIFESNVNAETEEIHFQSDILPGDLLTFVWRKEPQHVAVVVSTNPIRIVHAYETVKRCVVNDLDAAWRTRIHSARRLKVFA